VRLSLRILNYVSWSKDLTGDWRVSSLDHEDSVQDMDLDELVRVHNWGNNNP